MGKCVPDICASVPGGVRCGSFLNPICCKAGEICLNNQCAVPCSTTNPCPNGQFCNNGQCQNIVCGDGRIDLPETCDPPGLQSTCEVGEICVGCTSCQSSSVNCGNLQLDPGEECDFDALGNQLGSCLSTEYCDSQTCTCGSFQQYCPLGTICPGNYVCDQANICSPCSTTNPCPKGYICSVAGTCQFPCSAANPCPSGYSCLADGTCQLPPGPGQCGNAQLETGEECEYIIGNAGQFTITSTCASSTKPVCNTQDCLCYQSPLTGFCGDGTLQSGIGEECDEGTGNGGSSLTCLGLGLGPVCGLDCQCARSGSYCGDGPPPDITAGEKCELPGSIGPNNGCPSGTLCGTDCSCSAPQCGNGRVEPGEQCDTRAFPGCLIGSPLTPFVSYCSSSCTCIYVDPPPASQPPGGNPPGGGNGPGNGNPSGPGNPASSSGGGSGGPLTCQEDDPKNPGQKKPTCNQASDCGDPTQYFCRYNCCFNKPSGGGGTGTGSPLE